MAALTLKRALSRRSSVGKQIDGIFEGAVYKTRADSGRIKALFLGQPERMPSWDIPGAKEVGMPNFDMTAWYGLMVPANFDRTTQKASRVY